MSDIDGLGHIAADNAVVSSEKKLLDSISQDTGTSPEEPIQHRRTDMSSAQWTSTTVKKRRRRFWRTLLFALIVVFVTSIVAGGSWYFLVFRKTPAYALKQVKKAYDTHDIELFNQYVDADAFCQQTVDDYTAWIEQNNLAGTATDVWSTLGNVLASTMLQSMKPQMVVEMKKNLLNSVEDARATFTSNTFSLTNDIVSMANPESFLNTTPESTVKTGKVTTLKFMVPDAKYGQSLEIDLLLRDTGRHLQVVRMGNFGEWLDKINTLEQAAVDLRNQQEIAYMNTTISVSHVKTEWLTPSSWTTYEDVTIYATLHNLSGKDINKYGVSLPFSDASGNRITDVDFSGTKLIKAHSSISVSSVVSLNLYNSHDKQVYDALTGKDDVYDVTYSYVHFTDGTEYRLHKKFE